MNEAGQKGTGYYGNVFIVVIELNYEKNDSGKLEPCTLCWGEQTDFVTSPNPLGLKKGEWKNLYLGYRGKGRNENLGPFYRDAEKFKAGKQPCPGKVEITMTDAPNLARKGKSAFGEVNTTAQRHLSFFIRATSGKAGAGSKSATAQQFINMKNGDLEKDSFFTVPGKGLATWPKKDFDDCKEIDVPKKAKK
jgi:hypothetical protein